MAPPTNSTNEVDKADKAATALLKDIEIKTLTGIDHLKAEGVMIAAEKSKLEKSCGLHVVDQVVSTQAYTAGNGIGYTLSQPTNITAIKVFITATNNMKTALDKKAANNRIQTMPSQAAMKNAIKQVNDLLCQSYGDSVLPDITDRQMKVYNPIMEGFNPHHKTHVEGEPNIIILSILNKYASQRLGLQGHREYETDLTSMIRAIFHYFKTVNPDLTLRDNMPSNWCRVALELINNYMTCCNWTPVTYSSIADVDKELDKLRPVFCDVKHEVSFGKPIDWTVENRKNVIKELNDMMTKYTQAIERQLHGNAEEGDDDNEGTPSPSKMARLSGGSGSFKMSPGF